MKIDQISCRDDHTLVLIGIGLNFSYFFILGDKLFSFGSNRYGQLGLNSIENEKQFVPLEVKFGSKISKIFANGFHSFILE